MSPSQHLISTHNADGKAIFASESITNDSTSKYSVDQSKWVKYIYANSQLPPDLLSSADLNQTTEVYQNGLPLGQVAPENGVAAGILTLPPGAVSPMHRSITLDMGVIVEGEVELHLDDGEVKRMGKGDTIVQRGAIHRWVNVTPPEINNGECKMFFVSMDAKPMVFPDGKELKARAGRKEKGRL